uniref:Uncharacterized protein n=1 Tax=Anguilla anguilla TaxID=7936 RepID=A0A0E9VAS1_ANGAN
MEMRNNSAKHTNQIGLSVFNTSSLLSPL